MKTLSTIALFLLLFVSPVSTGETKSFNRSRSFDVLHYVIRLKFDRTRKRVYGDTVIRLRPLNSPIRSIELDSFRLSFDSVRLEGKDRDLVYRSRGHKLFVSLDREYRPSETVSIRFRYSAAPKKGIYFVDALKKKGKVVRSAQIWTQGESEETHHWLPSFDFPDDKATTEQYLTVAGDETAIANGELVGVKKNPDGTSTYHFRMPLPHSVYLTSFVIGKYEKVTDSYKGIPLGFYVYPGQRSIVPKAFGKTKDMLRVFEDLTGIGYPYNKYDQTVVANFQFGGMENITATTMSDTEIGFARFRFGQELVVDLVSHELAHSWFGNLVTCRNWAELWLNEGFATYLEAVFREKTYGRANYQQKIKQDAAEFIASRAGKGVKRHGLFNTLADASDDDSMFDAVTYQKGSAVLHTLREEIGDELFWKGVREYLKRFQYKNVETKDLRAAMEDASGRDLGWFFGQWVYGAGYPKLTLKHVYDRRKKKVSIFLGQTQTTDGGTPEVFRLPLEVMIRTAKGEKTGKIVMTKRDQVFSFRVSGKPLAVILDRNNKIPLKFVRLAAPQTAR